MTRSQLCDNKLILGSIKFVPESTTIHWLILVVVPHLPFPITYLLNYDLLLNGNNLFSGINICKANLTVVHLSRWRFLFIFKSVFMHSSVLHIMEISRMLQLFRYFKFLKVLLRFKVCQQTLNVVFIV